MKNMRCGVAAVEALRAAGVSKVFGLMGSSTLEMYDALYDVKKEIEYIGVRHENCGMHMADAYGRVTQTPGVFICGQAGPGSANMVLGLAQAKFAYSPVVAITGLPSTEHMGRDAFQEIDQGTLFLPVTKRVMTVPRPLRLRAHHRHPRIEGRVHARFAPRECEGARQTLVASEPGQRRRLGLDRRAVSRSRL